MNLVLLLVLVVIPFLIYFRIFYKRLKLPNVYLVTGGVKTGKSFISVALAVLVIPAVLLDIAQIVFWVIGFIPYILSF